VKLLSSNTASDIPSITLLPVFGLTKIPYVKPKSLAFLIKSSTNVLLFLYAGKIFYINIRDAVLTDLLAYSPPNASNIGLSLDLIVSKIVFTSTLLLPFSSYNSL
jgi:hypothetical protein